MPRRFHHGATDSTSERAFASLLAGEARHLDLHLAHSQSAGRGQWGRSWHSAPGGGLYASFVLLPASLPPAAGLSVAAGLALLDTVRSLGLARAGLKWPNDLLVGPAKLGGILVESRGLDPARPSYVLGVGLNVGQRSFPAELVAERPVTSLALEGLPLGVHEVERALAERVAARMESLFGLDLERLAADYLDAAGLRGARLGVQVGEETLLGRCEGLSLVEGLHLATVEGERCLALEHIRSLTVVGP